MAEFDLFKVNVINRYSSFLEKGLTLAKRRRLTYRASKSVKPFWLHPHQRALKVFFLSKDQPLYVGFMYQWRI